MNLAILYHRVSTLDQDPTLARGELRAAAKRMGYAKTLEIEETGSGARSDRDGLRRVMVEARAGHVGAVLVWKLDRFGRSALDLHSNVSALGLCGVRFVSITEGIDLRPGADGNAVSNLVLSVLAGVAQFEREIIRERTRLGVAKAKAAGRQLGRPVEMNPEQRSLVARLRSSGRSWAKIAKELAVTPSAARRAHAHWLAEKGGSKTRKKTSQKPARRKAC